MLVSSRVRETLGIVDWKGSWPFEDKVSVTQAFFRPLAKYFLVSIATLLRQQEEIAVRLLNKPLKPYQPRKGISVRRLNNTESEIAQDLK